MYMKTGVIDVGGGLRGVYGTGVFDRCLRDGVGFDCCIGVSAGSANISSFLAGQKGRSFRFYYEYSFRKEYMGAGNFLKKGSFFDLNYVYHDLSWSEGENPLDYDALVANPSDFVIVATEAETARAKYFTKADLPRDNYYPLMASSAIPVVCAPYEIEGVNYFDGGLSDPVPLKKAFELGCDRVVLILTKPKNVRRVTTKDDVLARVLHKKYPMAAHALHLRAARYNRAVDEAIELEKQGKVLIVAPNDTCGIDTTKRDKDGLMRLYRKGVADGGAIKDFLQ